MNENRTWLWTGIGVAVLAAAVLLWLRYRPMTPPPVPLPVAPAPTASVAPPEHHPIEEAQTPPPPQSQPAPPPLPALSDSDADVAALLVELAGQSLFDELFRKTRIVHRIVATVDALPRDNVPLTIWPVNPAPGRFLVNTSGQSIAIAAENPLRYAAYVRLANAVDAQKLVASYVHYYPLFQQAYVDLGYPHGYFNDRLVAVIDLLLKTPQPAQPPALIQPHVLYQFADPDLEALSAGQKMLLRMGPENAAAIEAKLRQIRKLLSREGPPR